MAKFFVILLALALLVACSRGAEHAANCKPIPSTDLLQLVGPNIELSQIEAKMQPLAARRDLDKHTFAAKIVAGWKDMKSSYRPGDTIREFTMAKGKAGGYALIRGQCLVVAFATWRSVL